MSFSKGNPSITSYTICGIPIERKNETKFLGITLDTHLTLTSHIKKKINLATSKIIYLEKMRQLNFSTKAKRKIYLSLIHPILEYGSPILCTISQSNQQKLEVLHNRCLRIITNLPRRTRITTLQELSDIKPLNTRIKTLAKNWLTQAKSNPENSVASIREAFFPGFDLYMTPHEIIRNHQP